MHLFLFWLVLLEGSEPWANGGFTSLEYLHFIQNWVVYIPILLMCVEMLFYSLFLFLF
jgi:hypothetical protein